MHLPLELVGRAGERGGGGREGGRERQGREGGRDRRGREGREGGRDRWGREGGREGGEGDRESEAGEGGRAGEREREVDETWHPGGQNRATSAAGLISGHFEKFGLIFDKKKVWTYIWYI